MLSTPDRTSFASESRPPAFQFFFRPISPPRAGKCPAPPAQSRTGTPLGRFCVLYRSNHARGLPDRRLCCRLRVQCVLAVSQTPSSRTVRSRYASNLRDASPEFRVAEAKSIAAPRRCSGKMLKEPCRQGCSLGVSPPTSQSLMRRWHIARRRTAGPDGFSCDWCTHSVSPLRAGKRNGDVGFVNSRSAARPQGADLRRHRGRGSHTCKLRCVSQVVRP
ncbi:hypothetical protein ACEQUB_01303 [Ralstonia syzygii]